MKFPLKHTGFTNRGIDIIDANGQFICTTVSLTVAEAIVERLNHIDLINVAAIKSRIDTSEILSVAVILLKESIKCDSSITTKKKN